MPKLIVIDPEQTHEAPPTFIRTGVATSHGRARPDRIRLISESLYDEDTVREPNGQLR